MKAAVFSAAILGLLAFSSPASAQLGGLLDKAQKAQDAKKKIDSLTISDAEEQKIGAEVSVKVRTRFGVVQGPAVTKYVTLVGTTLTSRTERAGLPWQFIGHVVRKHTVDSIRKAEKLGTQMANDASGGGSRGAMLEFVVNKAYDQILEGTFDRGDELGADKFAVTIESAQVSASGGARGVGPDRAAKGGSNSAIVKVTVSAAELSAFGKAIV